MGPAFPGAAARADVTLTSPSTSDALTLTFAKPLISLRALTFTLTALTFAKPLKNKDALTSLTSTLSIERGAYGARLSLENSPR